MTLLIAGAVRTAARPTPAPSSAEIIRDLDLGKYLFWLGTFWADGSGAAVNTAPFVQTNPSLSGAARFGFPITALNGAWAGFPVPTISYQWVLNGTPIPLATSQTYTPVVADVRGDLACIVTATNAMGSASFTTNALRVTAGEGQVIVTPAFLAAKAPPGTIAATIQAGIPGTTVRLLSSNGLFRVSDDGSAIVVDRYPPSLGDYPLVLSVTYPNAGRSHQIAFTVTVSPPSSGTQADFSIPANSGLHPAL